VSEAGARSGHPDPEHSEGEGSQEATVDSSPLKRIRNDKGNGKRFGKGIDVRGRKLTAES